MKKRVPNLESRIEDKLEVQTYIDRLQYAIINNSAKIEYQVNRRVDNNRDLMYTNKYTIGQLFPNESPVKVLKRELLTIGVKDYINTIKDKRFPKRSDMRVFGKTYCTDDVYVKIRVELCTLAGDDLVFVMSFHFAEYEFAISDFPYRG